MVKLDQKISIKNFINFHFFSKNYIYSCIEKNSKTGTGIKHNISTTYIQLTNQYYESIFNLLINIKFNSMQTIRFQINSNKFYLKFTNISMHNKRRLFRIYAHT